MRHLRVRAGAVGGGGARGRGGRWGWRGGAGGGGAARALRRAGAQRPLLRRHEEDRLHGRRETRA